MNTTYRHFVIGIEFVLLVGMLDFEILNQVLSVFLKETLVKLVYSKKISIFVEFL